MAIERQAKDGTVYQQVGNDEWTPVTRQAKDGTMYRKVGADSWAPVETPKAQEPMGNANDYAVAAERGILFGARPFVAGVGGGIGGVIGRLERNDGSSLVEKIQDLPDAFRSGFSEERTSAQNEESELQQRRPGLVLAGDVGGALLTAPLLAAKGAQVASAGGLLNGAGKAAAIGAGMGSAQALGHANSAEDAAKMIGTGTALGFGTQVGVNAVSKAAPAIWNGLKAGVRKTASALTGVSEKEISTYASRADEVKKLINQAGGDLSAAADTVREGVSRDIQVARQKLNSQIGQTLRNPKYATTKIDARAIVQKLDDAISNVGDVTARFRPEEINNLKNVRDLVAQSLDANGQIGLQALSEIKEELQNIAKPSYNNGSAIFAKGDLAAKASKGAAGEARRLLNAAAPEIKAANDQLRKFHVIEEGMNKNLIRAGKPESALIAAGSGANPRNAKFLTSIDEITGGNAMRQAENLAAGRTFSNTQILPIDATGKSLARMMTGGGVGTIAGGPVGGIVGTALTSPMALKGGINAVRLAQAAGRGISRAIPEEAVTVARTTAPSISARRSLGQSLPEVGAVAGQGELDQNSGVSAQYQDQNPAPLRGKDKWTSEGFDNLVAHGARGLDREALMQNPKTRELLMRASSLKPGSKAMDGILKRIESEQR